MPKSIARVTKRVLPSTAMLTFTQFTYHLTDSDMNTHHNGPEDADDEQLLLLYCPVTLNIGRIEWKITAPLTTRSNNLTDNMTLRRCRKRWAQQI